MDYYSILGVNRNATPEQIKAAYRKLAMQHHPDRGGDHNKFAQINSAYEVLSNSDKKNAYDNPQPQGFNFNSSHFNQGNPFSDMFNTHMRHTPRNRDITLAANIDLKDVITGKSLILQYQLSKGQLETVTVDIPKGARHGDTIRYQGLGDDADRRFPRGDLHIKVRIGKTKNWDIDNNNLITKKSINVFDFVLGCVIIIETLDNRNLELKIPKGTKPGTVFNISGYGVPDINTGRIGNLYVGIEAIVPKINDAVLLNKIEQLKNEINNAQ
jgi:curved DNA-binding protein